MRRGVLIAALWAASLDEASATPADSWPPSSEKEHFSEDHFYRFVVTPVTPAGRACAGALERWDSRSPGKYQPIWSGPLLNEDAPVDAVVDSGGRFVATFDNWSSTGYGPTAVVIYGPDGVVVRALSLLDLLTPLEIARLSMSASSVSWYQSAAFDASTDRHPLVVQVRQSRSDAAPSASIAVRIDPATGVVHRSDADLDDIAKQKALCQSLRTADSLAEREACRAKASSDVWCALCSHVLHEAQPRMAAGPNPEGQPLGGKEWQTLGAITGFHSVRIKKAGLEARLLEADASSSVARDPVALFLVVTNNATSDRLERVWRVPRGVARIRKMSVAACGVEIAVDVDQMTDQGVFERLVPRTLRLCFLSADGKVEAALKTSDVSP